MIPSAWKVLYGILLINIAIGISNAVVQHYGVEDLYFGSSFSQRVNVSEYYSEMEQAKGVLETTNPLSDIPILGGFIDLMLKVIPFLISFLKGIYNFLFALPELIKDVCSMIWGINSPITNIAYYGMMGVVVTSYGLTLVEIWRGIRWSG